MAYLIPNIPKGFASYAVYNINHYNDICSTMIVSNTIVISTKRMYLCFICILYVMEVQSSALCNPKYTNQPLNGYYCNEYEYAQIDKVREDICKRACFQSEECGAMSFNPVSDTCLLATQPCSLAAKHDEYRLMVFRLQEHVDCAVWVRDQAGIVPARMVTTGSAGYVARIAVNGNVLVGNGNNPGQNWNTYIAHEGKQIYYRNQDFLTVHPNCTMAWIPFTAGNVLPRNAIRTGMLANGRRLYSSRSWHAPGNTWVAGVYAEDDTAAYYPYSTSNPATSFDILVHV